MAIHALELGNFDRHHRPAARPVGCRPRASDVPGASGRWAVYAAVVAVGIAAFLGLDHLRSTAARALVPEPPPAASVAAPGQSVVARPVAAGETLWSIAVELRPGSDPRPIVDELARLNGGPQIQAGASVLVPLELARAGLP